MVRAAALVCGLVMCAGLVGCSGLGHADAFDRAVLQRYLEVAQTRAARVGIARCDPRVEASAQGDRWRTDARVAGIATLTVTGASLAYDLDDAAWAREEWRESVERMPGGPVRVVGDGGGGAANSEPVLMAGETVDLAVTLRRGGAVGGGATRWYVRDGSRAALRRGGWAGEASIGGEMVVSAFESLAGGGTRAEVRSFDLRLSDTRTGERARFERVDSPVESVVLLDARGVGELVLIGRLAWVGRPFFEEMYESVAVRLPVSADGGGLRIRGAGLSGARVAPVSPLPAYTPGGGAHPWCEDADRNGIPDEADWDIASLRKLSEEEVATWFR